VGDSPVGSAGALRVWCDAGGAADRVERLPAVVAVPLVVTPTFRVDGKEPVRIASLWTTPRTDEHTVERHVL
jgi:hypothetical protein